MDLPEGHHIVSLTYGHDDFYDFDSTTGWAELGVVAANGAWSISNGDYADLENTGGAVNYGINNSVAFAGTNAYPSVLFRYKTSSTSIKASVVAVYSDASEQTLLAETSSTTWVTTSATLSHPVGETLSYIQLLANDATGHVYYDFVMTHVGTFTLPNVAYGMDIDFLPREAVMPIPGKDTDAIQNLGTQSAVVTIGCDLSQGTWTRTGDSIDGEVFLDILHNRSSEPWQWLNTGSHQFKVTVHPRFDWPPPDTQPRRLDLTLREYSRGDKSEETYAERYGIGL